jgi:hypothetical protein
VHVLALEIFGQRQFDGFFLAAHLDRDHVAVAGLALHQFLQGPVAASAAKTQNRPSSSGDKVLQQAVRVNVVGHGVDGGRLDAALVQRGKAKLGQLGGDDSHDESS